MKDLTNNVQILIFEAKNNNSIQKFGLNIFKVQEILTYTTVTQIVNSDPAMLGLIKSREELIPLLDLSMVLFNVKSEIKKESIVIICHGSGKKIALLVNNVSNIIQINWEDVKAADVVVNDNGYTNGYISFENELISLLNLETLMIKYLGISEQKNRVTSDKIKHKNVLVIDDSKFVHDVVEKVFKTYEINPFKALNGQEALDKLSNSSQKYDLILCDIEMPIMNGYKFLEEAKKVQIRVDKMPPIVMYSSLCDDVSIKKAKELGAAHYITKYNMDKIIEAVEKFAH